MLPRFVRRVFLGDEFEDDRVPLNEDQWKDRARKLEGWKRKKVDSHLVFTLVLKLFAGQDVAYACDDLRIIEEKASRKDLEPFIPQLCTYFLDPDNTNASEIKQFVLRKARTDVAFAHEVLWYFLSSLNEVH